MESKREQIEAEIMELREKIGFITQQEALIV